jgi:hypothetical protein
MKHNYTIDNGRYVISGGDGQGSHLSEKISLFAEDISGRFAENIILSEMKEKSVRLNKRNLRLNLSIIIVSIPAGLAIAFMLADSNSESFNMTGTAVSGIITGIFMMLFGMLISSFFNKEELSRIYIDELVESDDVKAELRSYYEGFAVLAISDHIRVKGIKEVDVSKFKIKTIGRIKKEGFSSAVRSMRLCGECHYNNASYKLTVMVHFNPEYYNLKVIGFSID